MRAVNDVLGSLRLEKHPAKTFTLGSSPRARIENGIDFLGYDFTPSEPTDSKATILERAARLYEQERKRPERISARETTFDDGSVGSRRASLNRRGDDPVRCIIGCPSVLPARSMRVRVHAGRRTRQVPRPDGPLRCVTSTG